MLTLAKLCRWLLQKITAAALIVVFGVAAFGLWVYLKDSADLEQWRQDSMRAITGKRGELQIALADVTRQLEQLSAEISKAQHELHLADRVIAGLKESDRTWDRFFGDREQWKINRARLDSVRARRDKIETELAEVRQRFTHTTWTKDGLEIALGKEQAKLQRLEAQRSKVVEYWHRTWNYEVGPRWWRLPIKAWLVVVLASYFLGPSLMKLALYFIIAPLVSRGRPVRLAERLDAMPQVSASQVAAEITLLPNERLWIKEKFLQASDEALRRKSRYLLDWRIPFTCLATGLVELIEMANTASVGEQRVTLSNQADPHTELAVVRLPEGASIILRPSFLAGIVTPGGRPLRIRRRWQLWRWQAWITLQFRYFQFEGPCQLIVAGSRGVRAEDLVERAGASVPARRTNQDATVGFTPNLEYRPVRAETFWSYYRGMNPLFDDLFAGRGIFLCQQVAADGDAQRARKFWSGIWSGVLKVFGL